MNQGVNGSRWLSTLPPRASPPAVQTRLTAGRPALPAVYGCFATIRARVAQPLRSLLAPGAFFVLSALVAGCGNGVPGNAVARVDDEVIKRDQYNHWVTVAARSSQPPGAGGAVVIPDPPRFTKCVANQRRTLPRPPAGQPQITDQQLRDQCRQEYDALRDQVLQFLVEAQWIQGEAAAQDIEVSDKAVQASFQTKKRQSFPNEADYRRFLAQSGMTQDDVLLRVKLELLSTRITEKISRKATVTDAQIAAYYRRNKQRFAQPQRRDLQVIQTRSRARAIQARQAIQRGQPWPVVARRYSTDAASKSQGGRLPDVIPGQQERGLDNAIFRARRGQLVGPIKTQFGYYVFRVSNIQPPTQQTLAQARDTIRQLLRSQNQQKALQAFVKSFERKWKAQTNCRRGYIIEKCRNAPAPRRTNTVPPGAVPRQGAPPGAPPQGAPPQGAAALRRHAAVPALTAGW